MNNEDLQKELNSKLGEGIKPSDIKKTSKSSTAKKVASLETDKIISEIEKIEKLLQAWKQSQEIVNFHINNEVGKILPKLERIEEKTKGRSILWQIISKILNFIFMLVAFVLALIVKGKYFPNVN